MITKCKIKLFCCNITMFSCYLTYLDKRLHLCFIVRIFKHYGSLLMLQEKRLLGRGLTGVFGEHNTIMDNGFGWVWRVNFPKSNKGQDSAANDTLRSGIVASRSNFHTVGKYYTMLFSKRLHVTLDHTCVRKKHCLINSSYFSSCNFGIGKAD